MVVDIQLLINALTGALLLLVGYFMRDLQAKLKELKVESAAQGKCIAEVKLLVSERYVKKDEHEKLIDAMFRKLDAISDKVDGLKSHAMNEISEIKINCAAFHGEDK